MPPFTFDFHISSICRCFNIFPARPPVDEAGCLQILYHIPAMLEEPWMKHTLLQGYTPNSAQLVFACRERQCCARVHVFTCKEREKRRQRRSR